MQNREIPEPIVVDEPEGVIQLEYLPAEDGVLIPLRVYRARDSAGNPKKINPILYFHGLFDHSGWAAGPAAELLQNGFSLYAFDRRGSGLSQEPRGVIENYRTILADADTCAQLALARENSFGVHILASGFGALPALLFAIDNPDLCLSVTLGNPLLFSSHYKLGKRNLIQWFFGTTPRRPLSLQAEQLTEKKNLQELIRRDILAIRRLDSSTASAALKMQQRLLTAISRCYQPTCMMLAGADPLSDEAAHRDFFEQIPSPFKSLLYYPEAQHCLEYSDESERYLRDLATWLDEVERIVLGPQQAQRFAKQATGTRG